MQCYQCHTNQAIPDDVICDSCLEKYRKDLQEKLDQRDPRKRLEKFAKKVEKEIQFEQDIINSLF